MHMSRQVLETPWHTHTHAHITSRSFQGNDGGIHICRHIKNGVPLSHIHGMAACRAQLPCPDCRSLHAVAMPWLQWPGCHALVAGPCMRNGRTFVLIVRSCPYACAKHAFIAPASNPIVRCAAPRAYAYSHACAPQCGRMHTEAVEVPPVPCSRARLLITYPRSNMQICGMPSMHTCACIYAHASMHMRACIHTHACVHARSCMPHLKAIACRLESVACGAVTRQRHMTHDGRSVEEHSCFLKVHVVLRGLFLGYECVGPNKRHLCKGRSMHAQMFEATR